MCDQARDADAPRGFIKAAGLAVVVNKEEVVGRCQPGFECLPLQQVANVIRDRIRRGLVEPRNHLIVGVPEGLRQACHPQHRQLRQRRPTILQQGAPRKILIFDGVVLLPTIPRRISALPVQAEVVPV